MEALTPQEKSFRKLIRIWTVLFGLGTVTFLCFGDRVLWGGNYLSAELLHLPLPVMPLPVERFWLALSTSLMVTITTLCYFIQRDPSANLRLTPFLLVSKLTSTLVFFSAFFWDRPYFNYLLGSVFCDGPIFVVTFYFYRRALQNRPS